MISFSNISKFIQWTFGCYLPAQLVQKIEDFWYIADLWNFKVYNIGIQEEICFETSNYFRRLEYYNKVV